MSDIMIKTIYLNVSNCPIQKVVVYQPGARITRSLTFEPTEIGLHRIIIEGISTECDRSSLSVSGIGSWRIDDVTTDSIKKRREYTKTKHGDETKNEINKLIEELRELFKDERRIKQKIQLNDQKKELLKVHVSSQLTNSPKDGFTQFKLPDTQMALDLLEVYSKTSEEIDDEKRQLSIELDQNKPKHKVVVDRLETLLENINLPRNSVEDALQKAIDEFKNYETIEITVACIDIDVFNLDSIVKLELSYQVYSAHWNVSYDFRSHNQVADLQMFGSISQWSNEDWKDVALFLSCANLQEDKIPPTLPLQIIGFKPSVPLPQNSMSLFGSRSMACAVTTDPDSVDGGFGFERTGIEGNGISMSYAIERKTTIAANRESHKVMIVGLQLPCELFRLAVPSLSPSVFIQAKLTNLSEYQFLETKEISVYLDGSFIGKTSLNKRVLPSETCYLSIGCDPTISMVYIPPRPFTNETGLINKTRRETYEAITYLIPSVISDCDPILVAIVIPLPSSTDAKILVKLLEPDSYSDIDYPEDIEAVVKALEISSGRRSAFINTSTNHIINIIPLTNSKFCIKTKYVINYPSDKKIEIIKNH